MFPIVNGIGYVPIFPPSRHKAGTGCLIKKLTLFPSKPKFQTSSKSGRHKNSTRINDA